MSSQDRYPDETPEDDERDPLDDGLTAAENDDFAGPEDVHEMLDESE